MLRPWQVGLRWTWVTWAERGVTTRRPKTLEAVLAHALAQQAYVLLEIDQPEQARELAEHAVGVGGTAVPPVLAAWLKAVVGEITAMGSDASAVERCFDRAARLLPADPWDPAVPYIMLDEFHLARWHGTALARLGDESAIVRLQYALTGMDSSFVRARAQLHIELAHALIAADHVDQARREVAKAKTLAVRVGSARQRRRARSLELQLNQAS
ncbi:MAG: hypothetical protein GEU81_14295 [Nitriliruptorales bacterium]|nr:hypothetical protein [Nitriliruptorales bacterium]